MSTGSTNPRGTILREAWRLARAASTCSGRPAREHLGEAQREAWRAARAEAVPIGAAQALADLAAAVDAEVAAFGVCCTVGQTSGTEGGHLAIRRALAAVVERAIDLMDALDAATEDLEEEPDHENGADDEDGADAEAVDEDGDPLDLGEVDGWRRPRQARVPRTEWPVALAERELHRAFVISAVMTSGNVVRFPGGRHG